MTYATFGLILNFFGTLLLILKFVLIRSMDIITKNINYFEGYGLTTATYDPESMTSLLHLRSLFFLALIIIALGFLFQVFGANVVVPMSGIVVVIVIIILVLLFVPGFLRLRIISDWNKYLSRDKLFHSIVYDNLKRQHENEVKSKQDQINFFINKGGVLKTLAISLDLDLENSDLKTIDTLMSLQDAIRKNLKQDLLENIFYYLRNFRKLKGVYF